MLELLSPAGSQDAVIAAVQNGADAVYLGFGTHNARRGARNFTDEEFEYAIRYCRVRGCKVYVTLNTLLSDRELPEASAMALRAARLGINAILVQDLGLARILRRAMPSTKLHASTQMSIHNLAGVEAAAEMGMSRVVLARELTLEQISYIAARSPIELEVFVHGAHCFCYSGQCYMSSLIGRRSGNRGLCAQPCRLKYSMGTRTDEYPLSLKDNCLVAHLRALEEAGVKCVKIEGRMRRPEYVAIVTGVYSRAIRDNKNPTPAEISRLESVFSRQGFTDGYLTGKTETGMFGVRTDDDRAGAKLFAEARRSYQNSETRRVPVSFYAVVGMGEPVKLAVADGDGNNAVIELPPPEPAATQVLTGTVLEEQLYRTGGTPYRCSSVSSKIDDGVFLPSSQINDMRRKLLSALTRERSKPVEIPFKDLPAPPVSQPIDGAPVINIQVQSLEQLTEELAALGAANLYLPLSVIAGSDAYIKPFLDAGTSITAVMPRVFTGAETSDIRSLLERARSIGIGQLLIGNMGHIKHGVLAGFDLRGDFGLNAFNSASLDVLRNAGLISATASFELRMSQIKDLLKPLPVEIIIYGRLPLMVTKHCLIKRGTGRCSCHGISQLSDRRGALFPVMREFGCRNVIFNSKKLFMADKRKDYEAVGLWGCRLMFTTESPKECVKVMKSYLGQSEYSPNGITRGLYYRGVE